MRNAKSELSDASAYMTRGETVALLQVKPATLYTYVSRGWVRRIPHPDKKQSLYLKEDVEKIRARSGARAADGVLAAGAIRYGEPVIATSITEITPAGPRYRNRSAVDLVKANSRFEATAELLWSGTWLEEPFIWRLEALPNGYLKLAGGIGKLFVGASIHELFSILTLSLGMASGSPNERMRQGATVVVSARQLIQALTGCFGVLSKKRAYRPPRDGETIAEAVARALAVTPSREAVRALNAALTLSADHELNPATFAARIAASSEVDLHSCIAAAICTHSGARIARACDHLEDIFDRATTKAQLLKRTITATESAPAMTGFNHPLYPKGDPRAACLLELVRGMQNPNAHLGHIFGFLDEAANRFKLYPRMELGMVVLEVALRLPPRSAAGIYTLGRVAGWVAHIMEQRLAGFLIRPRAKYLSPVA